MYEFLTYKKRTKQEKRTDVPRASQMCHHVNALRVRTSDAVVQYRILHVFPRYYQYLATGATLGKEQETKVRWKKILRVIAKKNFFFLRSTLRG